MNESMEHVEISTLEDYFLSRLSSKDGVGVELHLAKCDACAELARRVYASLPMLSSLLRPDPVAQLRRLVDSLRATASSGLCQSLGVDDLSTQLEVAVQNARGGVPADAKRVLESVLGAPAATAREEAPPAEPIRTSPPWYSVLEGPPEALSWEDAGDGPWRVRILDHEDREILSAQVDEPRWELTAVSRNSLPRDSLVAWEVFREGSERPLFRAGFRIPAPNRGKSDDERELALPGQRNVWSTLESVEAFRRAERFEDALALLGRIGVEAADSSVQFAVHGEYARIFQTMGPVTRRAALHEVARWAEQEQSRHVRAAADAAFSAPPPRRV